MGVEIGAPVSRLQDCGVRVDASRLHSPTKRLQPGLYCYYQLIRGKSVLLRVQGLEDYEIIGQLVGDRIEKLSINFEGERLRNRLRDLLVKRYGKPKEIGHRLARRRDDVRMTWTWRTRDLTILYMDQGEAGLHGSAGAWTTEYLRSQIKDANSSEH